MIITFASGKGGSGKSTTAINFAAKHIQTQSDLMALDCDKQHSFLSWSTIRGTNTDKANIACTSSSAQALRETLLSSGNNQSADIENIIIEYMKKNILTQSQKYEDLIVDVPGHDSIELRTSLTYSDIIVYPIQPSNLDVWVYVQDMEKINNVINNINPKLKIIVYFNRINPLPSVANKQIQNLKEVYDIHTPKLSNFYLCPSYSSDRASYQNSIKEGLGVVELDLKNKSNFNASLEVNALYNYILEVKNNDR